ncbi:hypothetical protein PR048_006345 [Dryococelus australis]|uniref:Uncharacterized protein n=1 Tax=Dryococelus australis TaxID=614101 RepID=A0ABQ9IAQ1_9NEOP|nr:hypothetical protein PR048_006345 [Dryococelus australis]
MDGSQEGIIEGKRENRRPKRILENHVIKHAWARILDSEDEVKMALHDLYWLPHGISSLRTAPTRTLARDTGVVRHFGKHGSRGDVIAISPVCTATARVLIRKMVSQLLRITEMFPARRPACNSMPHVMENIIETVQGHLKALVYATRADDLDTLRGRIVAGCKTTRNTPGMHHSFRESMQRRLLLHTPEKWRHCSAICLNAACQSAPGYYTCQRADQPIGNLSHHVICQSGETHFQRLEQAISDWERLKRTGLNPRLGHRIFASGNRAERCRLSEGFLGELPFPPLFHSDTALCSILTSLHSHRSQDLDVKSLPNHSTPLSVPHLWFVIASLRCVVNDCTLLQKAASGGEPTKRGIVYRQVAFNLFHAGSNPVDSAFQNSRTCCHCLAHRYVVMFPRGADRKRRRAWACRSCAVSFSEQVLDITSSWAMQCPLRLSVVSDPRRKACEYMDAHIPGTVDIACG